MKTIYAAGGKVQFLDMDEPLVSALGLNKAVCHLDIEGAAVEIQAYMRSVMVNRDVLDSGVVPQFIDTESYLSLSVRQIEMWLQALIRSGGKPEAFHIDANLNYINTDRVARARLVTDLQELKRFLAQQKILFGIIIWSGLDPVRSDKEYYDHAMGWVRIVHDAIGRPELVIFASWVTRCSLTGECPGPRLGCSTLDPTYCGSMSVPLNLPESDASIFSHTRLINEAMQLLIR